MEGTAGNDKNSPRMAPYVLGMVNAVSNVCKISGFVHVDDVFV